MKDRNFSLLNHILCAVLAKDGISPEYLGALALPDAAYTCTGMWQYSHFAFGYGFTFPARMYGISKETIGGQVKDTGTEGIFLPEIRVGGEIDLERYGRLNKKYLPREMYYGIRDHLHMDRLFDAFLRSEIDCSGEEQGIYAFHGQAFAPEGIGKVIGQANEQGTCILAGRLYQEKGITADNAWVRTHVIPMLEDAYGKEFAKCLVPELAIGRGINQKIKNHEFRQAGRRPMKKASYDTALGAILRAVEETDKQLGK